VLELLTAFLGELRRAVLERSNLEISGPLEVMVAVPANAASRQRWLTLEAFRRAGWQPIGLINEPTAAAIEFAVLRPARERRAQWMPIALACVAGMVSLSVTFPMGSVSELYGFGANVMIGLLVGVALTALWRAAEIEDRGLTRTIAMVGGAAALMVGLYGLAGRAHHFGNIWLCTRTANDQIVAFMDTRPAAPKYGDAPISTIYFPASCRPARSYGAYIMPVAQAVDILNTVDWM
jgi:hypothetical protein